MDEEELVIRERAQALREEGRGEEARELLVDLAGRCPDAGVQLQAARVHDALGRGAEALPYYQRAIESGCLDGEELESALIGLGSAYRSLGRDGDAVRLLERAMRMLPRSRVLEVLLAAVYLDAGRHDEAAEILLRQLVETTSDAGIQRHLGAILQHGPSLREAWDQG